MTGVETRAQFEAMVGKLTADHHTDTVDVPEMMRRMDLVVSAARAICARRFAREPLPSLIDAKTRRVAAELEDPGIYAINQSIMDIARRAGVHVDE